MAVQQQINLYQPIFRKQQKVFSASTMLLVFIIALVIFAGVYGYARWNVYSLEAESIRLAQQQQRELVRLDELSRKYPVKQKSLRTEQQLKDIQAERDAKQFLVRALSGRSIGNEQGFSEYFAGIARQSLPGMWLTRLELDNGGDIIGIHGRTLQPELVPKFLQQLANEQPFAGSNFKIFSMQRDEHNKATVNFSLRTIAGGDK